MFKKIAILAVSLLTAGAALAGSLTTTAKIDNSFAINVDHAQTVEFVGGTIKLTAPGGVIKVYSDNSGASNYLKTSAAFQQKFAQVTTNYWFNATLQLETRCSSGATLVVYPNNTQEFYYDQCGGATAVRQNSVNP